MTHSNLPELFKKVDEALRRVHDDYREGDWKRDWINDKRAALRQIAEEWRCRCANRGRGRHHETCERAAILAALKGEK